jgi:DNA-binding transcriptional LysR family regulator
MDLDALVDFNAVAQHHGFGPASRALGRSKATLSRRVAQLEESLGVRLVERGARRLRLTEEGIALHERTLGLLAELHEAGEAVASRAPEPAGKLRISAPVVFAHVTLARAAAGFALAYPRVEVELVAEDRIVDPVEDHYDLVIRINPPADELLIGRRIVADTRMLVASPELPMPPWSGSESEEQASALAAVMLSAARPGTNWTVATSAGETRAFFPTPVLRLSSLLMVREAVLAGAGAALLPGLLVERDVATGRLACWGKEAGPPVEIWALYSSRRLLSAKVRAFLDMLERLERTETPPLG